LVLVGVGVYVSRYPDDVGRQEGDRSGDQGGRVASLQDPRDQRTMDGWYMVWHRGDETKRNETKRKARDPSKSVDRLIR
jgi:hypothetical protein